MAVAAALLLVSLYAQWLHFKTPGIPRTPDGKPNLTAPAPRTADGHPDLSGLWRPAPNMYWADIIQDIKDEAIFKSAAEAIFQKRIADYNRDSPYTRCLPLGPGDTFVGAYRIIQSPAEVALLRNGGAGDDYRMIFMDGREVPEDPNPTSRGYSVGRLGRGYAGGHFTATKFEPIGLKLSADALAKYAGTFGLITVTW